MKKYTTKSGYDVLLDDEDYQYLIVECGYCYCVQKRREKILSIGRNIPVRFSDTGKQKLQFLHWDVIGHPGKGMVTDHIDGNPLNNQKDNLWHCSVRENDQNKRHKSATRIYTSKYPGVSWNKNEEKWIAHITINRKIKHLGYFINEEYAAEAYQIACNNLENN